jgi:hypothetical protein
MSLSNDSLKKDCFGVGTKILAGVCHNCGICPYANRKPNTPFEKLMRWHRNWCPAWAAHTKVYGVKNLSKYSPSAGG